MSWQLSFDGIVTRVFSRSQVVRVRKVGDDIVTERGPELWHIQIGDLSFLVGDERPEAMTGDRVSITIRKVSE